MSHPLRRAFTFVELIVLLAVLIFLIALMVPAIKRTRAVEGRAECLDNMRQIVQATTAYAKDHAGQLIDSAGARANAQTTCGTLGGPRGTGPIFHLIELKYIANSKLARCPSIPDGINLGGKERIAYMINPHPALSKGAPRQGAPARQGRAGQPNLVARYRKLSDMPAWRCLLVDFMYALEFMPHNDQSNKVMGVNMAFPDGHAAQSDSREVYQWASKLPNGTIAWEWLKINAITGFNEHLLAKKDPDPANLGKIALGGGSFFDPYAPAVDP